METMPAPTETRERRDDRPAREARGPSAGRRGSIHRAALALLLLAVLVRAVAPTPAQATIAGIRAISAGDDHTCAVTAAGGVKCWGDNTWGKLGDGATTAQVFPMDVIGLSGEAIAISAGHHHNCALIRASTDGGAVCWGANYSGQLGTGDTTLSFSPVPVRGLSSGVRAISAGRLHTCALTTGGGVKCWGYGFFGQLGNGSKADSTTPVDVVGLGSGVRAISASPGADHTCALTDAGGVKCWGGNRLGALGNGGTTDSASPVDVSGLSSGVRAIGAGGSHTCAVVTDRDVRCWGSNGSGQLGIGTFGLRLTPTKVVGLPDGTSAISAGLDHTCALNTSGAVYCWGSNARCQITDCTKLGEPRPLGGTGLTSGVIAISAGWYHNCALLATGGVKCWGANNAGQLGNGSTQNSGIAVAVIDPPRLTINDVSVTEGNAGTTIATFTVSLSAPALAGGVTFDIFTVDGSATAADGDYVHRSLTGQTIPAGSTTYRFAVTVNGDTRYEANETFSVRVVNLSGALFRSRLDGWRDGANTNEDAAPPVTLGLTGSPFAENGGRATVTATLAAVSGLPTTVALGLSGTATPGTDYTASATSIEIPAGALSGSITLTGVNDTTRDPDQTVIVDITSVTNGTEQGAQQVTAVITNDDFIADLAITMTNGTPSTVAGVGATYTIVVSNTGPDAGTGANVVVTLPPAVTSATWTCVATGGAACLPNGTGSINANVIVPPAGAVTFTLIAQVSAGATGALANTATVMPMAGATDPTPANNSATDSDTLVVEADVRVSATSAPATVMVGQQLTFTVTATNHGPSNAQGVALATATPFNTTFAAATPSAGGSCTTPAVGATGSIVCTWAGPTGVGAGTARTLTLVVVVEPKYLGGNLNVGASVSASTFDPTLANNTTGPSAPPPPAAMAVSGAALVGGQPPVKATVEALVGGTVCGQATTGAGGAFSLSVSSAGQQAGCGTNGAAVTFRLNGLPASGSVVFASGGAASGVTITQP